MAFNFYSYGQDKAVIGMKVDSTVDVIDSYAAEGTVYAGNVVERGTDPATQVAASTTAANVIGIAIFENKSTLAWADPTDPVEYPEGYAVPVCTFGDVWVVTDAAVTAGSGAYINATGGFTDNTGTAVTGMTYMTSAGADELVMVRVRL